MDKRYYICKTIYRKTNGGKREYMNIEISKEELNRALTPKNNSNMDEILKYVASTFKRRMIFVIVIDLEGKMRYRRAQKIWDCNDINQPY